MFSLKRSAHNPILKPDPDNSWEAEAAFNGCPVKCGSKYHMLYRAVSAKHFHAEAGFQMEVSDIGQSISGDGIHFDPGKRFIIPEESWEKYGCEDPRITKFGKKYYIFYTAISGYPFNASGIKVGLAISKDLKHIQEKHLITPFNAKAMALFPEKINGKMCSILTAHTDTPPAKIAIAFFDKPEQMWSQDFWKEWHDNIDNWTINLQRQPQDHIEVGAPPLKTKQGWLLIYSYIRNYFGPSDRVFSIEAALLDLKDPRKILARTHMPIMTPEEPYELMGRVPDIIFPSGALIIKNKLRIYYGAADTSVCLAETNLKDLINYVRSYVSWKPTKLIKPKNNPILVPDRNIPWESKAVFNPAAFYQEGRVHIVYRAMSADNTSVLGYATSRDGVHIDYTNSEPIYIPREDFESKKNPGGNSGCEDPRITKIGNTLYMFYTAYDGKDLPRIAFTSILVKDFLDKKWNWKKPILISPPEFDNKDACLFPKKIEGKYLIFHRMGNDIDIALVPNLDFKNNSWLEEQIWIKPRRGFWDSVKVGVAAPPIETKKGWVLLYHGVSKEGIYRVGAVLLSLKDPTKIIARTDRPLFEPEMPYEKSGQVPNVVFPCGCVVIDDKFFIYYGGADSVVAVATIGVNQLLDSFK